MKKLHLICNAHLDPIWQWTWDEGIAAAISTFRTAADLCEEFDYIFCHNEALLYEAVERCAPELFARITKLIRLGKWKIIGGWYLQPDCNMPSGESLVRQIKAGQKYFYEKFGVRPSVACNFDSFGHSAGLIQIMKKCGYEGYIITRPSDNIINYPGRFFDWVSPDGSSITVCRVDSYGSGLGHAAQKITRRLENAEDVDVVLWGVGNHGGGPSRKDLRDIQALEAEGTEILHSTPEALFADNIRISGEIKTSLVPVMPGCYTSMMKIKQAHRKTESVLYYSEKLISAAALAGCNFDTAGLNEAEKNLLFAEFHDILPGSGVEDAEAEGLEILGAARRPFKDEATRALTYLAMGEEKAADGEYPIFVFNPQPYEVSCPVEAEFTLADQNWDENTVTVPYIYSGGKQLTCQQIKEKPTINLDWRKRIIFEGTLKPMSLTRFDVRTQVVKKEQAGRRDIPLERAIEKSVLKAPVSLRIYDDTADPWGMSDSEAKNGMGTAGSDFRLMTAEEGAEFCRIPPIEPRHLIEDGDVYTGIEEFSTCGATKAVTEYRIYKNHPYVDLKVTVEFAEKNKLIRLRIPVGDGKLIGDGPYINEYKIGAEATFQKWLGIEKDGKITAVINDGVYAGKYADGAIELTILRGSGYLFHPIGDRELYPSDRYLPRIDSGRYTFNFRIFEGDIAEVTRLAEEFSHKPEGVNLFPIGTGKKRSEIRVSKPVCMPVCKTGENGTIMRFFNPSDASDTFTLTVNGKSTEITMQPYEVVSAVYANGKFRIHRDDMPV